MKLTKVQKATRFIVYTVGYSLMLSSITGILPVTLLGLIYQIFGI